MSETKYCCWNNATKQKYIRKGRANYRCPECDDDITLITCLIAKWLWTK
jgi:transposase-like protein